MGVNVTARVCGIYSVAHLFTRRHVLFVFDPAE